LSVESDSETRETLKNKACLKDVENRLSPKVIKDKVCPKIINKSRVLELVECKSEIESDDECTVSVNNGTVSIPSVVELVSDNEDNVSNDEPQSGVTSISIDECQITINEDCMGSTDINNSMNERFVAELGKSSSSTKRRLTNDNKLVNKNTVVHQAEIQTSNS